VRGRGAGEATGFGEAAVATKQSQNHVVTKTWLFIYQLSISQTSERFFPEVKHVEFCILIIKNVLKI
jgi:hypothetical protein